MRKVLIAVLLIVLILPSTSGQQLESSMNSGQDLQPNYTQEEVEKLVSDIAEDAEHAIDEAYAEGYKAGLLESAPDAEYWRAKAEENTRGFSFGTFAAGCGIGAFLTITAEIIISYIRR